MFLCPKAPPVLPGRRAAAAPAGVPTCSGRTWPLLWYTRTRGSPGGVPAAGLVLVEEGIQPTRLELLVDPGQGLQCLRLTIEFTAYLLLLLRRFWINDLFVGWFASKKPSWLRGRLVPGPGSSARLPRGLGMSVAFVSMFWRWVPRLKRRDHLADLLAVRPTALVSPQ